jgi:hypothetical protein
MEVTRGQGLYPRRTYARSSRPLRGVGRAFLESGCPPVAQVELYDLLAVQFQNRIAS